MRPRHLLASALLLTLLPMVGLTRAGGPARASDDPGLTPSWPQFHNSVDHVGVQSNETTIGPDNVDELAVSWSVATGASVLSSPVVSDGIVYFGSDDAKVYAVDALTGSVIWTRMTGGEIRGAPAVVGGVVYVGSWDGIMYALDGLTGVRLWTFSTGTAIKGSVVVAGGTAYFASVGNGGPLFGTLWAVSTVTHKELWSAITYSNTYFTPTIVGGVVYQGWENDDLIAYDSRTGNQIWSATLGGAAQGSAAVSGGKLYTGGTDGYVYALDAATGTPLWKANAQPPGTTALVKATPVVFRGLVYVGTGGLTPTMDSWMYAFDANTGIEVWSHGLADYSTSSPAYANGVVYVGSFSHQLYGFDAVTGAKLWDSGFTAMGGGIPSSPAVANAYVYVGSLDGRLYAFTDTLGPPISTLVTVSDFQFDPTDALNHKLGNKVQWTNLGPSMHTVTDDSGMGLFDSGVLVPGSAFSFAFMGAGIYKYSCTRYPSMTGTIKAPMVLAPESGDLSTTFTIQWAGGKSPAGYVYDVQIWRPRAADWVNWMTAQTIASATFVPDGDKGTYQFRARFTNTANGNSSAYSAAKNIDVS